MEKVLVLAGILVATVGPLGAVQIDLVSTRFTNAPAPLGEVLGVEVSADGHWAALTVSDDSPDRLRFSSDVFLRNLTTSEDILVSHATNAPAGSRGNDSSIASAISADGRFVLFESDAGNLVENDDNEATDVFLFDRVSGQVILVSRALAGSADGDSTPLSMSPDGRFAVFSSDADNLVENDTNDSGDIFLFDRETSEIKLVTENYSNTGPATGALRGQPLDASVSADGRYVLFLTSATNLVSFAVGIVDSQVYLRDMQNGSNQWLDRQAGSKAGRYASSPEISTNGQSVAFITANLFTGPASDKPSTFIYFQNPSFRLGGEYDVPDEIVGAQVHTVKSFAMTPDGRRMVAAVDYAFSPFTGGSALEIYDNESHTNAIITLSTNAARPRGSFANPQISADGNLIFFTSNSPDLPGGDGVRVKLYRHDMARRTTDLLAWNGPVGEVLEPSVSSDGSVVAFTKSAIDSSDPDGQALTAYVLSTNSPPSPLKLTVVDPRGVLASGDGRSLLDPYFSDPAKSVRIISRNGRFVVFTSEANNLAPLDTNIGADIFLRDLERPEIHLINVRPTGGGIAPGARLIGMSADGSRIAWQAPSGKRGSLGTIFIYNTSTNSSESASILPDGSVSEGASPNADFSEDGRYLLFSDSSGSYAVYVRDLQQGTDTLVSNYAGQGYAFSAGTKFVLFYATSLFTLPRNYLLDWSNHTTNYFAGYPRGTSLDDSASLWLQSSGNLYVYYPAQNSSNLVGTNVALANLSGDGSTVVYNQRVFGSNPSEKTFIYDVAAATRTPLLLGANGPDVALATEPAITPDGRFIAFNSATGTDTNGYSRLYLYDRASSELTLLSVSTNGLPANAPFGTPAISADGQTIVFDSIASDLVPNDWNLLSDVFVATLGRKIQLIRDGRSLVLSWKTAEGGTLQQAPSVLGPWTTLEGAPEPYPVPSSSGASAEFYRVIYSGRP